jgi:hypothetical protein
MDRREALRLLATGAVLPLAPPNLLTILRQARLLLGEEATLRTLNPHQFATVKVMAELILPRTDTPGATDIGASEFIDLMLTEWYDNQDRTVFLNGLADLDSRTRTLFDKPFIECSLDQQAEILASLGQAMTEEASALPAQPREARRLALGSHRSFYSMVRRLTLTAYYTSEAGATAELNFQIIPDRFDACAAAQLGKQGAAN